jgi:hypothetical protein
MRSFSNWIILLHAQLVLASRNPIPYISHLIIIQQCTPSMVQIMYRDARMHVQSTYILIGIRSGLYSRLAKQTNEKRAKFETWPCWKHLSDEACMHLRVVINFVNRPMQLSWHYCNGNGLYRASVQQDGMDPSAPRASRAPPAPLASRRALLLARVACASRLVLRSAAPRASPPDSRSTQLRSDLRAVASSSVPASSSASTSIHWVGSK